MATAVNPKCHQLISQDHKNNRFEQPQFIKRSQQKNQQKNQSPKKSPIQLVQQSTIRVSSGRSKEHIVRSRRELMIQKIKKQTEQIKEMKRNISVGFASRLNQMKKITNHQNSNQQQEDYHQLFSKDSLLHHQVKRLGFSRNSSSRNSIESAQQINRNQSSNHSLNPEAHRHEQADIHFISIQQLTDHVNSNNQGSYLQKKNQNQIQNLNQSYSLVKMQQSQEKFISQQNNSENPSKKNNLVRSRTTQSLKRVQSSQRPKSKQKSCCSLIRITNYTDQMTLEARRQLKIAEARQKIMANKVRLLQSQTNFKLQKKVKQNLQLLQKHKNLYELIHSRIERERQLEHINRRKHEQRRLVHESKAMKISIQRSMKKQLKQEEAQLTSSKAEQSLLDLTYKRLLEEKKALSRQENLNFRWTFSS